MQVPLCIAWLKRIRLSDYRKYDYTYIFIFDSSLVYMYTSNSCPVCRHVLKSAEKGLVLSSLLNSKIRVYRNLDIIVMKYICAVGLQVKGK